MLDKPIEDILSGDLDALVANGVPEGRVLDYKEALPGGSDDDRKDFLADMSAFANTAGGHVVYGIAEERDEQGKPTGIPRAVVGLQGNLDAELLKLENLTRDSIDPRIIGIRWQRVPVKDGTALVCRIPKSWQAPHMVTFKGMSRFYVRDAAGKHPLDVQEIRAAFIASEGLGDRIRRFRQERLARISSDEAPMPLWAPARIALHVAPVQAFDDSRSAASSAVDLSRVRTLTLFGGAYTHRYNLDGVLAFEIAQSNHLCTRYTQVFRNGIIEGVDTVMLRREKGDRTDANWIPNIAFEGKVIEYTRHYLAELVSWGIPGPVLVMLSLIGVRDYVMGVDNMIDPPAYAAIDRDMIAVPETWIEELPANPTDEWVAKMLRGALDAVWQAAGFPKSLNFTAEGEWKPRR